MLNFFSREPGWFLRDDVPIAERVASHIALVMSHHQLAEKARVAAEANARAERLESQVQQLTDELDALGGYRRVIGESQQWREVLRKATQVAGTEATVLLLGESGTGKEVIARFVHRGSARRERPIVALNCAALPEHLLEAELFGFEAGAFTGAMKAKPGQIEHAAGGVLFLDEVGEMTPTAQAKFLRVLQEREFQRLGSNRVLRADVRVIAATNRDLRKSIERGSFREDLYYRLHVFELEIPPLRERPDDILPSLTRSLPKSAAASECHPLASLLKRARRWSTTNGPETFASCGMFWSALRFWLEADSSFQNTWAWFPGRRLPTLRRRQPEPETSQPKRHPTSPPWSAR